MKNNLMIFERKEQAVVSSRMIATDFTKEHNSILKTINGEKRNSEHIPGLADGILASGNPLTKYFIHSTYENRGKKYPEYLLTRDGFSLLVMGFTGEKALEWKLKYIEAFNRMEFFIRERQSSEWLLTRKQGKLIRRSETDTIANLIEYAKVQGSRNADKLYVTYSKLVNSLVGIKAGQRDSVPFKTISTIGFLEDMILHTIGEEIQKGTHYKQIYKICKVNGEQIMRFAYLAKPEALAS